MTWQIRQREAELLGEKRGIAIGEKRGIAIGEERGEKRGIAISEERGEKRGKLETARAMLREAAHGSGRALHRPLAGRTAIAGWRNCPARLRGKRI